MRRKVWIWLTILVMVCCMSEGSVKIASAATGSIKYDIKYSYYDSDGNFQIKMHNTSEWKNTEKYGKTKYGKITSNNGRIRVLLRSSSAEDSKYYLRYDIVFSKGTKWTVTAYKYTKNTKNNKYSWIQIDPNTKKKSSSVLKGKGCFDLQWMFELNDDIKVQNKNYKKVTNKFLEVNFYDGDYNFWGLNRVYSNTKITGVTSENGVKFHKRNCQPLFITYDDRNSFFSRCLNTSDYNGSSNISFLNFILDCKKENTNEYYYDSFLYVAHGKDITVSNVTVQNGVGTTHVIQLTAVKNVTIKECKFNNLMYIYDKEKDKYILADSKYAKNNGWEELSNARRSDGNCMVEIIQIEAASELKACPMTKMNMDETYCENIEVSRCRFNRVFRTVGNHAYFLKSDKKTPILNGKKISILNNEFSNVVGTALPLPAMTGCRIVGNKFANVASRTKGYYVCVDKEVGDLFEEKLVTSFSKNRYGKYIDGKMYDLKKNNSKVII